MLTQSELQIFNWVYSAIGWKCVQMPLIWENGKLLLKETSHGRTYNGIICLTLLSMAAFRLKAFPPLIAERDIQACIFQTIFIARYLLHVLYRQNIRIFKTELVRVINQSIYVNTIWGKSDLSTSYHNHKLYLYNLTSEYSSTQRKKIRTSRSELQR